MSHFLFLLGITLLSLYYPSSSNLHDKAVHDKNSFKLLKEALFQELSIPSSRNAFKNTIFCNMSTQTEFEDRVHSSCYLAGRSTVHRSCSPQNAHHKMVHRSFPTNSSVMSEEPSQFALKNEDEKCVIASTFNHYDSCCPKWDLNVSRACQTSVSVPTDRKGTYISKVPTVEESALGRSTLQSPLFKNDSYVIHQPRNNVHGNSCSMHDNGNLTTPLPISSFVGSCVPNNVPVNFCKNCPDSSENRTEQFVDVNQMLGEQNEISLSIPECSRPVFPSITVSDKISSKSQLQQLKVAQLHESSEDEELLSSDLQMTQINKPRGNGASQLEINRDNDLISKFVTSVCSHTQSLIAIDNNITSGNDAKIPDTISCDPDSLESLPCSGSGSVCSCVNKSLSVLQSNLDAIL